MWEQGGRGQAVRARMCDLSFHGRRALQIPPSRAWVTPSLLGRAWPQETPCHSDASHVPHHPRPNPTHSEPLKAPPFLILALINPTVPKTWGEKEMLWSTHHVCGMKTFSPASHHMKGIFTILQMRKSSQKGDLPQGQGANKTAGLVCVL